jgi:DNA-binding NarL/FixJ family response regulator
MPVPNFTPTKVNYRVLPPMPLDPEQWLALARTLQLAPRQEKIVELILRGLQDKEIAAELGLKTPTVRTYIQRAFQKLNVHDRVELVLKLFAASHHTESDARELPVPSELVLKLFAASHHPDVPPL